MPLDSLQIALQRANAAMATAQANLTAIMKDPTSTPAQQMAASNALANAVIVMGNARANWLASLSTAA